uniref:Reverse transcriptase domain-containing protein n=1 Tax=Fagus sylvatica TaxID=28930 RepID=A0A2N9I2D8_FAGSY
MHKMAVEFYEQLLGTFNNSLSEDDVALVSQLFSNQISEQQKAAMQEDVSSVEIQRAIFNMNGDKSPGPDDFWTHFFKKVWSITQEDVINAVQYFFKSGGRRLRQGDPLSPYLFVLAMEVFSKSLQQGVNWFGGFKYHPKCAAQKLTHLYFADELLVFLRSDLQSIRVIQETLGTFKRMSGLTSNIVKSEIFIVVVSLSLK